MRNLWCFLGLLVMVFFSCEKKLQSPEAELIRVCKKLKQDEGHKFLKTLRPLETDFDKIFIDSLSVQKAKTYSDRMWNGIDGEEDSVMKPENLTDETVIVSASKKELKASYYLGNLSSNYIFVSDYIKDDIRIYGINYIQNSGKIKSRTAFFKIENRWIFIPFLFNAFVSE